MAQVVINGESTLDIETEPGDSVLMVLLKGQQKWGDQYSIEKLWVNDQEIHNLNEETLGKISAEDAKLAVSLKVMDERTLSETLNDARAYLQRLEKGFEHLSEKIREGTDPESHKTLSDGINGILALLDLFSALHARDEMPDDLKNDFNTFLGELNDKARELKEAQEADDVTLIADIVEYEFVEMSQMLQTFLDRFEEHLNVE